MAASYASNSDNNNNSHPTADNIASTRTYHTRSTDRYCSSSSETDIDHDRINSISADSDPALENDKNQAHLISHVQRYFREKTTWEEKDFIRWCRRTRSSKLTASVERIRCYWVNSLKNLAKDGDAQAGQLLHDIQKTKRKKVQQKSKVRTQKHRDQNKDTKKQTPSPRKGSVFIPRDPSQLQPVPERGEQHQDAEASRLAIYSHVVLPKEGESFNLLNLTDPQVPQHLSADEFAGYQRRTPKAPKCPKAFEDALSHFLQSPAVVPEDETPEVLNLCCWLRRVSENIQLLADKLKPHWNSFLTEGFFDTNVWGPIIDNLWLAEQDMILVRKEVELLRKDERQKMDGIIRFGNGIREFDLGVLEGSKALVRPKSNQKTTIDTHKVTHAMALMLYDLLRIHHKPDEVQVIGFVCSGWGCVVLRMWCDIDVENSNRKTFVLKEKPFALVFGKGLLPNVEFLRTLVRYRELARRTVAVVSYQPESDI